MWRTTLATSHIQKEEAPLRQNNGLKMSISLSCLQGLTVVQPLNSRLGFAIHPAGQCGRIPNLHHHIRGMVDYTGRHLICPNPSTWEWHNGIAKKKKKKCLSRSKEYIRVPSLGCTIRSWRKAYKYKIHYINSFIYLIRDSTINNVTWQKQSNHCFVQRF